MAPMCVRGDFCREGYAWASKVVVGGGDLHYLCSDRWSGECTAEGGHSFHCERFFNGRTFRLPIEFHRSALCDFFEDAAFGVRIDAEDQVKEYVAVAMRVYGLRSVVNLSEHVVGIRAAVRSACAGLKSAPDLDSRSLLNCVRGCLLPRRLLPASMASVRDHAECTVPCLLASRYLSWIKAGTPILLRDYPSLETSVLSALSTLPPELRCLVLDYIFIR
jgi:hypothetical protein